MDNASIELIDCDGVLSAGFARHLAHRQRSIQTDDSSLDTLFIAFLAGLVGGEKDPPLYMHRLCGERCDALCVQFRFPLIPASRVKKRQSQHRSHDNYQRFHIKISFSESFAGRLMALLTRLAAYFLKTVSA